MPFTRHTGFSLRSLYCLAIIGPVAVFLLLTGAVRAATPDCSKSTFDADAFVQCFDPDAEYRSAPKAVVPSPVNRMPKDRNLHDFYKQYPELDSAVIDQLYDSCAKRTSCDFKQLLEDYHRQVLNSTGSEPLSLLEQLLQFFGLKPKASNTVYVESKEKSYWLTEYKRSVPEERKWTWKDNPFTRAWNKLFAKKDKQEGDPRYGRGGDHPLLMRSSNTSAAGTQDQDLSLWDRLLIFLGLKKRSSGSANNGKHNAAPGTDGSGKKEKGKKNASGAPHEWENVKKKVKDRNGKVVEKVFKVRKLQNMPYFNQCVQNDGSLFPPDCWQMCGAASVVMVAGQQGKLKYDPNDPETLKKYMYTDNGQGITATCGPNKGGAFGVTNANCNANDAYKMKSYLNGLDVNVEIDDSQKIRLKDIQESIDAGKPVIMGMTQPVSHFFVVVGYTDDGGIVVHDPFNNANLNSDAQENNVGAFSHEGREVIYFMDDKKTNREGTSSVYNPNLGYQIFIK